MQIESKPCPAPGGPAPDLLHVVMDAIARIASERDVDKLLIAMADMGRDLVGAESCTLWMLDARSGELWSRVSHELEKIRISADSSIAGAVARQGKPEVINDPYGDTRFDAEVDRLTGSRTRNIIALPVRDSQGSIIGVFQAVNKVSGSSRFSQADLEHFLIAATYIGKQLESVLLQEEIEDTQREIIFTLAETAELRSKETGYHVKRVAEYSFLLATLAGMPETEAEILKLASPLHDIGKIAIPDAILLKPGWLTQAEIGVMKTHTQLGFDMLKHSGRRILKTAAVVALEHHEKWDGSGYPRNLSGGDIHIYGRITAVADVFDALSVSRVYKKAWPLDKIISTFKEERGRHFDPELTDLFLDNMDQVMEIFDRYRDQAPREMEEEGLLVG